LLSRPTCFPRPLGSGDQNRRLTAAATAAAAAAAAAAIGIDGVYQCGRRQRKQMQQGGIFTHVIGLVFNSIPSVVPWLRDLSLIPYWLN